MKRRDMMIGSAVAVGAGVVGSAPVELVETITLRPGDNIAAMFRRLKRGGTAHFLKGDYIVKGLEDYPPANMLRDYQVTHEGRSWSMGLNPPSADIRIICAEIPKRR